METLSLATHVADAVALSAEIVRTFATVTFPACLLLKGEEIETLQVAGRSIIAAVYRGTRNGRNTFMEAPFDLMYGFRGNSYVVDLFSPFEMLRYWRMEKILPPQASEEKPTSSWTREGLTYEAWCKAHRETPRWEAGVHYVALGGADRILLPDLPALGTLQHRWYWQKRRRPYVPVWNYAKVPRVTLSPEENARLLCVYMRPWTLNPANATEQTPLLSRLGMVPQDSPASATATSTPANGGSILTALLSSTRNRARPLPLSRMTTTFLRALPSSTRNMDQHSVYARPNHQFAGANSSKL